MTGIPLIMIFTLCYEGIRKVVRHKMTRAEVQAMLSLFVKSSTSVEAQRVARLMGNFGDDDDEFHRQSTNEFMKLVNLQDPTSKAVKDKVIDITELGRAIESLEGGQGLEGTTINDICRSAHTSTKHTSLLHALHTRHTH